jgi:REP element-mobilizing transposase RayT
MTMPYDPNIHHRRSIRLPQYDYAQPGAYFVTICTQGREFVLDDPIVSGIITDVWHALPQRFPTIDLDEFVIMPNHSHLIVWIYPPGTDVDVRADRAGASPAPTGSNVGATLAVAPGVDRRTWTIPKPTAVNLAPTLGDVIGAFKSLVFTVYLDWIEANDPARRAKFWQRNYYEHVIRSDTELYAIRRYIQENPFRWVLDSDNPQNLSRRPYPTKAEEYLADAKRQENDP